MRLLGLEVCCFAAALSCTRKPSMMTAVGTGNMNNQKRFDVCGNVVVRTARLDEAKELTKIINDAFQEGSYLKKDGCAERVTSDGRQVGRLMRDPCCAFLVAEEPIERDSVDGRKSSAGRILGCVETNWSGLSNSGVKRPGIDAFFGMLSVKNEHQRRGIGKILVASAEQRCREELGKEYCMEITVLDQRPDLFTWYKAQGYVMGGKIPFPAPEIVKEGIVLMLQIMTKRVL